MSKKSRQGQTASIRQAVSPKASPQSGKAARAAGKNSKTHITKISAGHPSESAAQDKNAVAKNTAAKGANAPAQAGAGAQSAVAAKSSAAAKSGTGAKTDAITKTAAKSSAKAASQSSSARPEKPLKKTFILFRPFVGLGRYIRDSWRELRQVRWPSRGATWKMTLAVVAYCALFMLAILLLDTLFTFIFNLLLTK